jgi:hypothetical protein
MKCIASPPFFIFYRSFKRNRPLVSNVFLFKSYHRSGSLGGQSDFCQQIYSVNPWFITGFTDGDGCFSMSVHKASDAK